MENQKERIMHGATFGGKTSTIGTIICGISVILFISNVYFIFPLLLLLIGLILAASIEFIDIDYSQKRIRKVLYLVFYKHGQWMPLESFDKLVLGADHKSFRMIMPAHPLFQRDVTLRNYAIFIVNKEDSSKTFLMINSNTIPKAQKKLEEYAIKLNLEAVDTIKIGWEKVKERGRR